jgi:acyl-CoA synthetase (AMP-forming)/AMP-acid ligase II
MLRYAMEGNARTKPNETFAAFEDGKRWTSAQTLQQVESLAGIFTNSAFEDDHVILVLPTSPLSLRVMFAINYLGARRIRQA